MISLSNNPFPAKVLGWSGLLPLVGLAVTSTQIVGQDFNPATFAFFVYAGVILSFLGGIQWGLAIGAQNVGGHTNHGFGILLNLSIGPSLVAWSGVFLWQSIWGALLLTAGFVLALATDHWSYNRGLIPRWFLQLRFMLTCIVMFCLLFVAFRHFFSA